MSARMYNCPRCGPTIQTDPDSLCCPSCGEGTGAAQSAENQHCFICAGADDDPDFDFCGVCGRKGVPLPYGASGGSAMHRPAEAPGLLQIAEMARLSEMTRDADIDWKARAQAAEAASLVLREALEPFAKLGEFLAMLDERSGGRIERGRPALQWSSAYGITPPPIADDDFRRAREALAALARGEA